MFVLVCDTHIPIQFFVGKEAILIIVDELFRRSYSRAPSLANARSHDGTPHYFTMHPVLFYGVSMLLYSLVVTAAILIPDISVVFGLIGGTSSSLKALILPGAFFVISARKKRARVSRCEIAIGYFYIVFGVVLLFVSDFSVIYVAAR